MKDLIICASVLGVSGYYTESIQLKAENHQLQAKVVELETTIKGMLINK
jgi:hypothetical protein